MLGSVKLLTFAIISIPGFLMTKALAQDSLNLGSQLTASDSIIGQDVGYAVATSGDTVAVGDALGDVYVFVKPANGWEAMTQTAKLSPSTPDGYFGRLIAMSGDTIVTSGSSQEYVFVKPAGGWKNMTETAQLNGGISGAPLAIDGDTILIGSSDPAGAYIFEKPAGGWTTTATSTAMVTVPGANYEHDLLSFAVSGPTVVIGVVDEDPDNPQNSHGHAYVYEKPGAWWANVAPTATLSRSNVVNGAFGFPVAIFGDKIAVGALWAASGSTAANGVVDLFLEPQSGWKSASETVELVPPGPPMTSHDFGFGLALNDSHLVVGANYGQFFVYSQPPAGWAASAWPSQEFTGNNGPESPSELGESVGISGDFIATGDMLRTLNGKQTGDAYVFHLMPSWMKVSTDLLSFNDAPNGGNETSPLTITNTGTGTLNFDATFLAQPNFNADFGTSNCALGVPAGQTCTLPITFAPAGVGQHTTSLTLTSPTSASIRVVKLTGLAIGVGPASESTLEFGKIDSGSSETLPLVLRNVGVPGSPTVAVSFNNANYSLASAGSCAAGVPEGQTCTMMIKFAPTTSGGQSGVITLTPSVGSRAVASVDGSAN